MLEISSKDGMIHIKKDKGESLWSQLNELREVCAATIDTIALNVGMSQEKVTGGFLLMLEEDDAWKRALIDVAEYKNKEKQPDSIM